MQLVFFKSIFYGPQFGQYIDSLVLKYRVILAPLWKTIVNLAYLTGNKGHLSTVAIGPSKVYPNREMRARITAMFQIIQEVSNEIAILMTVAKSLAQTGTRFFLHPLIE